jgi:hypothetical protein
MNIYSRSYDFASQGAFFILCVLCGLCGKKIHADTWIGEFIGRNLSLTRFLNARPNTDSGSSIDSAEKKPNMADLKSSNFS